MYYAVYMNERITLSVIMLRKHNGLYKVHGNHPVKRFLGNMLYQSAKRPLTEKEAERAIAEIKKLRSQA